MTSKSHVIVAVLVGLAATVTTAQPAPDASGPPSAAAVSFDGFDVDERLQPLSPNVLAAFRRQLEIVESAGVPPDVLAFFKSVPIVVDPSQQRQPAEFTRRYGRTAVFVQDRPMAPDRPIVLHELLHAYHRANITRDGAEISAAYREALRSGAYPRAFNSAHFLENDREYFAVIGSIYLFGSIRQPPFDCAMTREKAPAILTILERDFGYHACE